MNLNQVSIHSSFRSNLSIDTSDNRYWYIAPSEEALLWSSRGKELLDLCWTAAVERLGDAALVHGQEWL